MTLLVDDTKEALIARMIRPGASEETLRVARNICEAYPTLRLLSQATHKDLAKIEGMTPRKAEQLLVALELGKCYVCEPSDERVTIRSPEDAFELLRDELRLLQQEHFICLYLNTKNQLIRRKTLFVGGLNASIVHPREVVRP